MRQGLGGDAKPFLIPSWKRRSLTAAPVTRGQAGAASRAGPTAPGLPTASPRATLVATTGPDELADFDRQTFRGWDRAILLAVRRAIDARRRELAGW